MSIISVYYNKICAIRQKKLMFPETIIVSQMFVFDLGELPLMCLRKACTASQVGFIQKSWWKIFESLWTTAWFYFEAKCVGVD